MGRARLLLLAIAGAVCGHTASYAIAYPDRAARASILELTGHAYWHAAVGAAVVAGAWFVVDHMARHLRGGTTRTTPWRALPLLQIAVYLGMEVSERVAAGVPVETVLDNLAFGIAVQVVVAAVLALATYLLGRTAAVLGRFLAARPAIPRGAPFGPSPVPAPVPRLAVVPCGSRGPPSS